MPDPAPFTADRVRQHLPERRRRRPFGWGKVRWLRSATGTTLVVMAFAIAAVGCSQDDDASPVAVSEGPTTVTRDEATTSSPPSTTTTTATATPTVFTDQARDAVNELKAGWEAGDRDRMASIAPADVVEALAAIPPEGFEVYGCDTGEFDTSTCNLRNRSTGYYITVNAQRHPAGWQVATIYVDAG